MADKACGADTRLILYMDVGEVLSRSFTAKDTHTPQGDLIVAFTNTEGSHVECNRRATGTGILLGFSSPCFAFGGDLILPVESNEQLREVFRSNHVLQRARRAPHIRIGGEDDVDDQLAGDLAAVAEAHREYATVYIPEVCGCCSTTARMSARDPIEQTGTYPRCYVPPCATAFSVRVEATRRLKVFRRNPSNLRVYTPGSFWGKKKSPTLFCLAYRYDFVYTGI